ncbi:hypothetical protein [Flammeovirga agarivorans]|uniref:Uncharacterized protein n=1 Tax=Flammeovirga agarivorans TaxID=2726742 RepID=A0A7X8SRG5_9BACT|nr:hypothetical protein [Flammeovirga agarivorans]NLR94913.1 hypothetical protein [Flammeovirga agarivorans]
MEAGTQTFYSKSFQVKSLTPKLSDENSINSPTAANGGVELDCTGAKSVLLSNINGATVEVDGGNGYVGAYTSTQDSMQLPLENVVKIRVTKEGDISFIFLYAS